MSPDEFNHAHDDPPPRSLPHRFGRDDHVGHLSDRGPCSLGSALQRPKRRVLPGHVATTVVTSHSPHTVWGTGHADVIVIRASGHVVRAAGGADTVVAGDGNDDASGGSGDDVLEGNQGDDDIRGDAGNDTAEGDGGNDTMDGNAGDDNLQGDNGDVVVNGGGGSDTFDGGDGEDQVDGGDGSDDCSDEGSNSVCQGRPRRGRGHSNEGLSSPVPAGCRPTGSAPRVRNEVSDSRQGPSSARAFRFRSSPQRDKTNVPWSVGRAVLTHRGHPRPRRPASPIRAGSGMP